MHPPAHRRPASRGLPAPSPARQLAPPATAALAGGPVFGGLLASDVMTLQMTAGNLAVSQLIGSAASSVAVAQRAVEDRPATRPVLRQAPGYRPDVEYLQERLNEEGVATPPLVVDGKFGPLTRAAVVEFQRRHGLAPDGIVGLRTWGMLDELERRGIAGPTRTSLDETAPVSEQVHAEIEAILHPNRPSPGEAGPEMTGRGPGGPYETDMIAALDRLAAETLARPVATAAVNMDHANRVGDRAQEDVESFFGADIALASRQPTGAWHPGSTRMGLADASTRPVSEGDILGWAEYFIENGSYEPAQVARGYHYDATRATPDRRERDRVRDVWLNTRGGRDKVRQMIRAWPAEAGSGTVFLQLRDPMYQDRLGMWTLFATMIHEFLHLVTHPNYGDAADAIGGGARDILIEGMDDYFKEKVWHAVRPQIASDPVLRLLVEGPFAQPIPNLSDYEAGGEIDNRILGHHYASLADARAIVAKVGEANARAAFFMGHVEALGIGPSSASEASLAGLASWTPGSGGEPDVYVVPPGGETVGDIRQRTASTHIEDEAGFVHLDPSQGFAPGQRLRVPGIRWHTAIAQDTRAQVANQHGVLQADLERANRLPPARGETPIPPGTLLLIPLAAAQAAAPGAPVPVGGGQSAAAAP